VNSDYIQSLDRGVGRGRFWRGVAGIALGAGLVAGFPAAGLAPTAPDEDAQAEAGQGRLEDIIVTARRRAERSQETPLSISAISGAQLETLNIVRIDGITQLAPSLRITQASGSGNAPAIYIRGIGTLSTALYVEPAVGVYIDGVYNPRPSGNTFDLPDIASVEVLRGPQGTLFGRNTTGGAILLGVDGVSIISHGSSSARAMLNGTRLIQHTPLNII